MSRRQSLHDLEHGLRGRRPRGAARASSLARLEREIRGGALGGAPHSGSFDRGQPVRARYRGGPVPGIDPAFSFTVPQDSAWGIAAWVEPFEAAAPAAPAVGTPAEADDRGGIVRRPLPPEPWHPPLSPPQDPGLAAERPAPGKGTPAPPEIDEDLAAIRRAGGAPAPVPPPDVPSPEEQIRAAARPAPGPVPAQPAEPPEAQVAPRDPHAVFEQMGRAMRYANTFALAPVELSRRFDTIERHLAAEEAVREQPKQRERLETTETDEDLRTIAALRKTKSSTEPAALPPATEAPSVPPVGPVGGGAWTPVSHRVTRIASREGLPPASAAAAMLVAHREGLPSQGQAVVEGRDGWNAYDRALAAAGDEFFGLWRLDRNPPGAPEVEAVRSLLVAHGPLWYGTADARGPALVIRGILGGPQPPATRVEVVDPSETPEPVRTISFVECFTEPPGGEGILAWSRAPAPAA